MAFGALALFWSSLELAFVWIRLVTIVTVRKWQRSLEITIHMAFSASDLGMLSKERVLRRRMVELKARKQFLPSRGGVTFFATLLEGTFVRIDMAVNAGLELHIFIARWSAGHIWLMALLAGNLDVKTGQRIAGLGVIELVCCFPVREVMTLQAIVSELTLVHVLVAGHAILRQSEKGPRKVFHLDERALIGNHIAGHVALLAGNVGMLAFQLVARLLVIKVLLRRLPVDQTEVFSIVLQMAADTVPAVRILHSQPGVVTVIRRKTVRNLFVAVQALEGWHAGPELMATRALRGSA
jgi:hypothetical protein